jgi:tetratricopeptide (TPR) repeat protein
MKSRVIYFLHFLWCFQLPISAQKCEELPTLVAQAPNDTNKVNLLWRWAGCYIANKPDSVILLCKQGEVLARQLNFTEGLFRCLARPSATLSSLGRFEEAERNAKAGEELSLLAKDTFNYLRFIDAYSTILSYQNKHKEVFELCEKGLKISISTGETYRRPVFYIKMGQAYGQKGDYRKSLEAFYKALPFSEKAGDKAELANIYINIANVTLNSQRDMDVVNKYARLALEYGTAINNRKNMMNAQYLLGEYHLETKKDTLIALQYFEQALENARYLKIPDYIAQYTSNLGRYYFLVKQYDKAITYLEESAKLIETQPPAIQGIRDMVIQYLGDGYFFAGNYDRAIQVYEKFLTSNQLQGINKLLATQHLAESYYFTSDYQNAYEYYQRYKILNDSILNAENAVRAKDLESIYQLGKKEDELKLANQARALADANYKTQRAEAERQRLLSQNLSAAQQLLERDNALQSFALQQKDDSLELQQLQVAFEKSDKERKLTEATQLQQAATAKQRWIIGMLSGLLALGGLGFYFWRARQKDIAAKKIAESELKALRSQLNPHFLFNSMNAINSYILENDRLKASEYLAQFAGVMRGILETSRNTTVTLEEELRLLENYIQIEQKRFAKPFDYQIKIDDNIDTFSTQVPAMLLQPFVENAIWHGFLHKPTKGLLKIEASRQNGQIVFTIG